MSDNPFSEPDDSDRTIVRLPSQMRQPPSAQERLSSAPVQPPFGAAASSPLNAAQAAPPASASARIATEIPASEPTVFGSRAVADAGIREPVIIPRVGRSPLLVAASPLLDLLVLLSSGSQLQVQGSVEHLRDRALQTLQTFEVEGRAAQVPEDVLRGAHYALCATLDDLALASDWAASSNWAARSFSSLLHQDVRSGQGFFDHLARMQQDPGRYLPALEICYLCLSLGMRGRYRVDGRGRDELESIREGLYQLLVRLSPAVDRELSVHWRGVDAPHVPPGRQIPAWVPLAIAVGVLAIAWLVGSTWINARGDDLQHTLAALPPAAATIIHREAPVVPPASVTVPNEVLDRFRRLLQAEIDEHLVTVQGDQQHVLIRLAGSNMFDSGSADIQPVYRTLLQRIGQALRDEPGAVKVVGHTDDQPIRTVQFPSNQALSTARAQSATAILMAAASAGANRFSAEGRADTEPLEPNTTAAARLLNRRIEIVLLSGEGR